MTTSRRRGFTLVELLIVIAIIGMLMGLLLPAIQSARARARTTTCSNNMRNVAMAIFEKNVSGGNGSYPAYVEYLPIQTGGSNRQLDVPWPVKLLPRLESQTVYDQLRTDNGGAGFPYNQPPAITVFNCPADASTNPDLGTLSFVINAGFPDQLTHPLTGGSPPVSDVKANGIAHDQRPGRQGPEVKFKDIPDGASTTLLLSENVHRDQQELTTWLGPVQPVRAPRGGEPNMQKNPEQRYGFVWNYSGSTDLTWEGNDLAPINRDQDFPGNFSDPEDAGFRFARPASAHPEAVNVAFCDGTMREIAETIDYVVYQQLMTPKGLKAEIPNQNFLVEERDNQRRFMKKPLNAGDY